MNRKEKIAAPFTKRQVKNLQIYQTSGRGHPFTCGGAMCTRGERLDEGILIPTKEGWICPCGQYTQAWTWKTMTLKQPGDYHSWSWRIGKWTIELIIRKQWNPLKKRNKPEIPLNQENYESRA